MRKKVSSNLIKPFCFFNILTIQSDLNIVNIVNCLGSELNLDKNKVKLLIKRYEDVYLFATKRISSIMSDQVFNDLSLEQFAILRILYHRDSMRASELAEILGVNKSAITVKVEKLEKKRLITRERDQEDRRNIHLHLSEKGQRVYKDGETKIENFVSSYLNELDPRDFELFINLYEKILTIIQKDRKESTG